MACKNGQHLSMEGQRGDTPRDFEFDLELELELNLELKLELTLELELVMGIVLFFVLFHSFNELQQPFGNKIK